MNYFKIITISIVALVSINAYADGCLSLENSNWVGQLQVNSGSQPLRMHIVNVVQVSEEFFALTGTINEEKLTATVGCVEQRPGNIRSILIGSKSMQLSSHVFIPNHQSPVVMQAITGKYEGIRLDAAMNASINYLSRL